MSRKRALTVGTRKPCLQVHCSRLCSLGPDIHVPCCCDPDFALCVMWCGRPGRWYCLTHGQGFDFFWGLVLYFVSWTVLCCGCMIVWVSRRVNTPSQSLFRVSRLPGIHRGGTIWFFGALAREVVSRAFFVVLLVFVFGCFCFFFLCICTVLCLLPLFVWLWSCGPSLSLGVLAWAFGGESPRARPVGFLIRKHSSFLRWAFRQRVLARPSPGGLSNPRARIAAPRLRNRSRRAGMKP